MPKKKRETHQPINDIALTVEGEVIKPNPKCGTCYGRGYSGFDANGKPITCKCLRKKYEIWRREHVKAKLIREGVARNAEKIPETVEEHPASEEEGEAGKEPQGTPDAQRTDGEVQREPEARGPVEGVEPKKEGGIT